jgi:hypothetical protein
MLGIPSAAIESLWHLYREEPSSLCLLALLMIISIIEAMYFVPAHSQIKIIKIIENLSLKHLYFDLLHMKKLKMDHQF